MVPERSKVFESLSVDENLDAAVGQREVSRTWSTTISPARRVAPARGGLSVGRRAADARHRLGADVRASTCSSTSSLGLAPLVVRDLMQRLRTVREQLGTILVVEQNAQVALDVADHAYVMENGRVVLEGARTPASAPGHPGVLPRRRRGAAQLSRRQAIRRSRRWYG